MGSLNRALLAQYQDENPEGHKMFNEDLIYARSRNDDTVSFILAIFKSLEVIEGIKILDVTEDPHEVNFPTSAGFKKVDYSRLRKINTRIKIDFEGESEIIEQTLYAPRLVDDFFFYLNGAHYFPIFQIIDRGTYRSAKRFTLKTMLLPLAFNLTTPKHEVVALNNDYSYHNIIHKLDLFSSLVNPFLYFLSSKGLYDTIEFAGLTGLFRVGSFEDFEDENPEEVTVFVVSKRVKVAIHNSVLTTSNDSERLAISLLEALKEARFSMDDLQANPEKESVYPGAPDRMVWLRRLGKYFTKSNSKTDEKGFKILTSFENIVESRTRENLSYLDPRDYQDTFAVVRWMMENFSVLNKTDNMDLTTKRIRISEYIVHEFLLKMSNNRYRLINTKRKKFKTLKNIFIYISEHFLVNQLVKNELLHYSNYCNQHDLLTVALRFTLSGRHAAGHKTDVGIQQRGLHESYIGRFSLSNASASSPGVTGVMTPYAQTNGQFFETNDIPILLDTLNANRNELANKE